MMARLEKLSSRLLQADEEKAVLLDEIKHLRHSQSECARLEAVLTQVEAEKAALQQKHGEVEATLALCEAEKSAISAQLDALKTSLHEESLSKVSTQREVEQLKAEKERHEWEAAEMKRKVAESQRVLVDLESSQIHLRQVAATTTSKPSSMEEWRQREARLEIAAQRAQLETLRETNSRLQKDLEASIRDTTSLGDALLRYKHEVEAARGGLLEKEEEARRGRETVISLERQNRDLLSKTRTLAEDLSAAEEDKRDLKQHIEVLKEDLDSMTRARRIGGGEGEGEGGLSPSATAPRDRDERGRIDRLVYLDTSSTDSEGGERERKESHFAGGVRGKARSVKGSEYASALSALEVRAAETMAHMLHEEILRGVSGKGGHDSARLKEACARAALRLIFTSSHYQHIARGAEDRPNMADIAEEGRGGGGGGGGGGDAVHDIAPLHALGNRDFLARLVAETQAGLVAIEDSKLLKRQMKQLEVPCPFLCP